MVKWVVLFCCVGLFAGRQEIALPRDDGSMIRGYFDRPEGEGPFPAVLFIDGSFNASVLANHERLAARFLPRSVGLISLEKRGITPEKIDEKEFRAHDCFEERAADYSTLLRAIEKGEVAGCNGRVVLLGGSEGGKIAPSLSLQFQAGVQGIVLVGSGGGVNFGEEMTFQSQKQIEQMGMAKRLSWKLRGAMFPKEVAQLYDKMLSHPESLEICGPKTWKWWASYLRYDLLSDLLKVEKPIYMIHGEEDLLVPVKSADLVAEAFAKAGKENLRYSRYTGLGHGMRDDVYPPLLEWVSTRLLRPSTCGS